MFGLTGLVERGPLLLASVAFESTLKVVILTLTADPATLRKSKLFNAAAVTIRAVRGCCGLARFVTFTGNLGILYNWWYDT